MAQTEKLTNDRANLREANPNNIGERCKRCRFFTEPDKCAIVVGPVDDNDVCDWIQSREVDNPFIYKLDDRDWLAFGRGMIKTQPYQHIVKDVTFTPEGPMVLIEDTMKPIPHRFSLTKDFHIEHTSLEHHWTQEEVDRLIALGKSSDLDKASHLKDCVRNRARRNIARGMPRANAIREAVQYCRTR